MTINNQLSNPLQTNDVIDIDCLNLVIVSGRSGSGKTSVLNVLEDFGYYVIDNLPLSLVSNAVEKLVADSKISHIALGIDARNSTTILTNFPVVYKTLQNTYGRNSVKVLYVTAQESILVARFDATRRIHPLMNKTNSLPKAIEMEINLLEPIATLADIKIDTSSLNIHELKEKLRHHLGINNQITVNLLSFGFKYGTPIDADFIFDVRILPNPHWDGKLKQKTGLDDEVKDFFHQYNIVDNMSTDISNFLQNWLPSFLTNNRHTVTVAIGCTGGKHRSVYIAEQIAEQLQHKLPKTLTLAVQHRERRRWSTE